MHRFYKLLLMICLHPFLQAAPLDDAIQNCFPDIPRKEISVKPLLGGHSQDEKFILQHENVKYVVKIYAESKNYSRRAELYMMESAGDLEVGPKVFFIGPSKNYVIMEFIEGGTLTFDTSSSPECCIKIAEAIRQIHTISKNPYENVHKYPLYSGAYLFLVSKVGNRADLDETFQIMQDSYFELEKIEKPYVSIHGDLNPRNIFMNDNGVKFIDWSITEWDDPFYDLAYFAMMSTYKPEMEELLLETYLGRAPTLTEWRRYYLQKSFSFTIMSITLFYLAHQQIMNLNIPFDLVDEEIKWETIIQSFMRYDVEKVSTPQGLFNASSSALREARSIAEQYLR